MIFDCWWGWLDESFRWFIKDNYPWILFLYVPAACTSIGQPMDAGIIAKVKGKMRSLFSKCGPPPHPHTHAHTRARARHARMPPFATRLSLWWAPRRPSRCGRWLFDMVCDSLAANGNDAEKVEVPHDIKTLRQQIILSLGRANDMLRGEEAREGLVACWRKTTLLDAWEKQRETIVEAAMAAPKLFGHISWAGTGTPKARRCAAPPPQARPPPPLLLLAHHAPRYPHHGTAPLTRRRRAAAAQEHYEWDGGEEEEPEATDDGAADWAAMEDDLEDEHGWGVDEGDDDGAEEDEEEGSGEDGGDNDE